jgi:nicotinamide-nucleotide amidase
LTARPGSSAYVLGGVTAYANSAKEQLVGVAAALLAEHGAVSPQVARALADGARARFGAEIGVGITGVAGPGGGTAEKPVGTVHLSVAAPAGVLERERSVTMAMHLLRELLLGGPPA